MDDGPVRFGLWYDFRNPSGRSFEDFYAETLDQIVWAEELGYGSVWLTEHHFVDDGYTPSPLVIGGALLARTTQAAHEHELDAAAAARSDPARGGRGDAVDPEPRPLRPRPRPGLSRDRVRGLPPQGLASPQPHGGGRRADPARLGRRVAGVRGQALPAPRRARRTSARAHAEAAHRRDERSLDRPRRAAGRWLPEHAERPPAGVPRSARAPWQGRCERRDPRGAVGDHRRGPGAHVGPDRRSRPLSAQRVHHAGAPSGRRIRCRASRIAMRSSPAAASSCGTGPPRSASSSP